LDPGIRQTIHAIGGGSDPYLYSQARVLAAKAVETYDPQYGASLPTWVNRQLMPLRRIRREKQMAIKIPDSVQLDAYHLMRAESDFTDEHGREPDLLELSDATKMSTQRIEKVRKQFVSILGDSSINPDSENTSAMSDSGGGQAAEFSSPDYDSEAMGYVYHESDYVDRKILEHKTGYGGADVLNGAELAAKLKISPAQVTRRAAKLTYKINEYRRMLEAV
jgi:DNA-directed RNA polymerase specialized sigma subunit